MPTAAHRLAAFPVHPIVIQRPATGLVGIDIVLPDIPKAFADLTCQESMKALGGRMPVGNRLLGSYDPEFTKPTAGVFMCSAVQGAKAYMLHLIILFPA